MTRIKAIQRRDTFTARRQNLETTYTTTLDQGRTNKHIKLETGDSFLCPVESWFTFCRSSFSKLLNYSSSQTSIEWRASSTWYSYVVKTSFTATLHGHKHPIQRTLSEPQQPSPDSPSSQNYTEPHAQHPPTPPSSPP